MAHWDGAQGQEKMAKIMQKAPPRKAQTQNEKFFFDFDYKTC